MLHFSPDKKWRKLRMKTSRPRLENMQQLIREPPVAMTRAIDSELKHQTHENQHLQSGRIDRNLPRTPALSTAFTPKANSLAIKPQN